MTNRSRPFSKLKQALTQAPATSIAPLPKRDPNAPRPWRETQPVPHEIPATPKSPVDFRDPSRLPHVAPLARGEGFAVQLPLTQVLPVVDLTATQPIPVVQDVPPSARHVDPVQRYYEQTFVEDSDLEPQARGRHVLDGLMALPDPAEELASAPQRIINDLGGPDLAAKDPARRLSVRMFRHARDMGRAREARCIEEDARLAAIDAQIKSFAQQWQHNDAHWDRVAALLRAKREASDAGQIEQAYAEGGTSVALCTVDQVAHEIAQRALAGSGVAA